MTKQPEALRLADVLIGSPQFSGTPIWQAADMLRRQHEAIKVLREALDEINKHADGVDDQWCGAIAEQALKDTEDLA